MQDRFSVDYHAVFYITQSCKIRKIILNLGLVPDNILKIHKYHLI